MVSGVTPGMKLAWEVFLLVSAFNHFFGAWSSLFFYPSAYANPALSACLLYLYCFFSLTQSSSFFHCTQTSLFLLSYREIEREKVDISPSCWLFCFQTVKNLRRKGSSSCLSSLPICSLFSVLCSSIGLFSYHSISSVSLGPHVG